MGNMSSSAAVIALIVGSLVALEWLADRYPAVRQLGEVLGLG